MSASSTDRLISARPVAAPSPWQQHTLPLRGGLDPGVTVRGEEVYGLRETSLCSRQEIPYYDREVVEQQQSLGKNMYMDSSSPPSERILSSVGSNVCFYLSSGDTWEFKRDVTSAACVCEAAQSLNQSKHYCNQNSLPLRFSLITAADLWHNCSLYIHKLQNAVCERVSVTLLFTPRALKQPLFSSYSRRGSGLFTACRVWFVTTHCPGSIRGERRNGTLRAVNDLTSKSEVWKTLWEK